MPIAKRRDNLSDLVDKAAQRRDRVNSRKRKLSTVHIHLPVHNEVIKLKEARRQKSISRIVGSSSVSVSSGDDDSYQDGDGGSTTSPSGKEMELQPEHPLSEAYIVFLVRLGYMSTCVYMVVEHVYWKRIRIFFTCLAIYTLACEVSLFEGSLWLEFFYWSNGAVNTFFTLDGVLKLWSFLGYLKIEEKFSTRSSMYGSIRRCGVIDFTIASLCFYFASSFTGNWLKLVRVMFIALFSVQQLTSLDVLMSGIGFGLHSVFYTWLLLLLVFIVYGAAGVTFYAENDPYHFGTIAISMWTFFQISTLDDWIEIMLLNSYGCDVYPVNYYPGPEPIDIEQYGHFYLPVCSDPRQQRLVSMVIFFSFMVIVGFVLMSLTIAAVTAGINDRLDNLQKEELREELSGLNNQLLSREESKYVSSKLANTGKVSRSISNMLRTTSTANLLAESHLSADPALLRLMLFQALNVKKKTDFGSEKKASRRLGKAGSLANMRKANKDKADSNKIDAAPDCATAVCESGNPDDSHLKNIKEVEHENSSRYTMSESSSSSASMLGHPALKRLKGYLYGLREDLSIQQLSLSCRNLTNQRSYNVVVNIFIIFGAMFEINSLQEDGFKQKGTDTPVNIMLQLIFTIDIIIKVLAVFPTWSNFWKNKWNRFDVCTVGLLWIVLGVNFKGLWGRVLELLRVLRIFRSLKLISKIPELHVIMMSIASSARALAYIVALMFIFFFHFAVAGIYLFEKNDPFHFEGLIRSFTTLFQVATLDNWGEVARINMLGCNNTDYDLDPPCTDSNGLGWVAAWYFIIFIVLGVMVLLSLFVGVIITSMELLKEGLKEEREVLRKVRQIQRQYDISDSSVEHLLEIFDMIDVGSNGKLTLDELKPVLEIVSVTPVQQFEMFVQVDTDRSGQIDFSEFCELIQLIGKTYIENEEKKGARIIRRTRTYNKMSKQSINANKPKNKYRNHGDDNISEAESEYSLLPSRIGLLRDGSSGSLVHGEWSDKNNKIVDVNEYNDDDLDKPVAVIDKHKNQETHRCTDRPRTNGGIWSSITNHAGPISPLGSSPRGDLGNKDNPGNVSGLSPVPSAFDLFSLRSKEKEEPEQHHSTPYVPVHQYPHFGASKYEGGDDMNNEHHFHVSGHTASQKLNLLNTRPSSATRPRSAAKKFPSNKSKDSEKPEVLHSIPSNAELYLGQHASVHPHTSGVDGGHKKLDEFSLADMSVHSLRNIDDYSMFGEKNILKDKPTAKREEPTNSTTLMPEVSEISELKLDSVDSRKSSMENATPHYAIHDDVASPGGDEEVWEVGYNSYDQITGL